MPIDRRAAPKISQERPCDELADSFRRPSVRSGAVCAKPAPTAALGPDREIRSWMARLHIVHALDVAREVGRSKRRLARRGHPLADTAVGETACEGDAVHLAHLAWVNESHPDQSTFGRRHGDLKNSCTSGDVPWP